jgi:hypothetical protein
MDGRNRFFRGRSAWFFRPTALEKLPYSVGELGGACIRVGQVFHEQLRVPRILRDTGRTANHLYFND